MALAPSDFKKHFDSQAKKYAEFAATDFSWLYITKPALAKILNKLDKRSQIIDLGCGHGRTIEFLISLGFSPTNIDGVDISKQAIGIARKTLPKEVNLSVLDIVEEKLETESYDLALAHMVVNSFSRLSFKRLLANVYRSLSEDGHFVYIASHPDRVTLQAQYDPRTQTYFEKTPWGERVPSFIQTIPEQITLLQKANFRSITVNEPAVITAGKKDPGGYEVYSKVPSRIIVTAKK